MKKAFALLLAALSIAAQAATTVPVQLLSPAGSTAGQLIASTGASSAPAWTTVTLSGLTGTVAIANGGTGATTQAAALSNLLGSSAVPLSNGGTGATSAASARTNLGLGTAATQSTGTSGATVPLLSTANTWTLQQAFTVRPTFNSATPWDSTNLATPASTVSPTFTGTVTTAALTATGLITPGGGIKGVASGVNAAAGNIGELIKSNVASGSAVALTTVTNANVTSIVLTAGDWDVWGSITFAGTSVTSTSTQASWGTTSATIDATNVTSTLPNASAATGNWTSPIAGNQLNVTSSTTVYLVARANFTAGTLAAYGFLIARRRQ